MSDAAGSPLAKLVVFSLDDQRYALQLASVAATYRAVEITPLPKAPDIVLGVINVQGMVIPVFNLRRRFRLPEREMGLTDQLIVAWAAHRRVALLVDSVLNVADYPADLILPPEGILPGLDYVKGVAKLPDGLVLIHELETFLSLDEEAALDLALRQSNSVAS